MRASYDVEREQCTYPAAEYIVTGNSESLLEEVDRSVIILNSKLI